MDADMARQKQADARTLLVGTVSYGKRVRVPDPVLEQLKVKEGDLLLFKIEEGDRVEIRPAMIVPRSTS